MTPRADVGPTQANVRHSSASAEHYSPPEIIEAARVTLGGIDLDPASSELANTVVRAKHFWTRATGSTLLLRWTTDEGQPTVFLNPPGGHCDHRGDTVIRATKDTPACTETGACGLPPGHAHEDVGSSQKRWWFKFEREWREGRVKAAIFVSFSIELLQTTQVGTPVCAGVPLDFPICFPSRRLAYYHDDGAGKLVPGKSPPHSSCIIYLPERKAEPVSLAVLRDPVAVGRFERAFSGFGRVVVPR